jgi:hypothetical protein
MTPVFPMNSSLALTTGFVPSLEALPLVAATRQDSPWRPVPCPSYGRVIRSLLTGDLSAGLIPWELGITELVTKPGQKNQWSAPLVIHPCPMELVLTPKAMKTVYPTKNRKTAPSEPKRLVFGIEARCSLTRYQILTWQLQVAGKYMDPPAFKVLPMELMLKGLEAGTLDGMVAPAPWGMQAMEEGKGRIDAAFEPGKYAQQVVLFCRRDLAEIHAPRLAALPDRLAAEHTRLREEKEFLKEAAAMSDLGHPHFQPTQMQKAAQQYLKGVEQRDFQPDRTWMARELRLLTERVPLGEGLMDLEEMADQLTPQPALARV